MNTMGSMGSGLRTRIIIFLLLVAVTAIMVMFILMNYFLDEQEISNLEMGAETICALALDISRNGQNKGTEILPDFVITQSGLIHANEVIRLVDQSGGVSKSTDSLETHFNLSGLDKKSAKGSKTAYFGKNKAGSETITFVFPIDKFLDARQLQSAELRKSDYIAVDLIVSKQAKLAKFYMTLVVACSAVVVLLLVISSFMIHNRHVGRSIELIRKGINEFQKGNFQAHIPLNYKDEPDHELGQLAQNINDLGERFGQMQSKIQDHYRSELEKADRLASVGELAASMAHEIKNPVAGISNAMQVLSSELGPDDENLQIFEEIQRQAQRVNRAINNLLSYARPLPPELVSGELNTVLKRTIVLMEGQMREANVKLEMNLDPDPPMILLDPQQMQQVFVNLVLNAIQAINSGGLIVIDSLHDDQYVKVKISDTGPGIPENVLSGIFIPFFTTKHKGTGLGLAICRSIVENHSGSIKVESIAQQGASFLVELPVSTESSKPGESVGES